MREQAEKWASFILANLLWILFAVPIITIPAATAGAFALIAVQSRGDQPSSFAVFFDAMRRRWKPATLVGLLDLAVGGFITANLAIIGLMNAFDVMAILAQSVSLFAGVALLLVNLYIWPLMVLTDMPLRELIDTAIRLALAHPLRSLGVLVIAAVPVVISLLLPRAFFLIVTISTCIYVINRGTWPIIRQHIPEAALTHR